MIQVNPGNERLKRRYLRHLQEAKGLARATIDNALRAVAEYEQFTSGRDFGKFKSDDAIRYKKHLLSDGGRRAAELSSRATVRTKLQQVQRFFRWLAEQPGFRTSILFSDVEYFNLSTRDARLANERRPRPSPTVEQVVHAIRSMPAGTQIEKRDRALIACVLLTGIRVSALISLKLKHIRRDGRGIEQDAREVRTKFSKSFPTFYFPVGADVLYAFTSYIDFLRTELLWGDDDPIFPTTKQLGQSFRPAGLERQHWVTPEPVRQVFRKAFRTAGIPYFHPHSLRRTLTLLGQRLCRTPEQFKCWSQNLGHDGVATTLTSYGAVAYARQAEIIGMLGAGSDDEDQAIDALRALRSDPHLRALFTTKGG